MGDQEGAPSRLAPAPEGSKVCKLQAMPAVASQVRCRGQGPGSQVQRPHWLGCSQSIRALPLASFQPWPGTRCSTTSPQPRSSYSQDEPPASTPLPPRRRGAGRKGASPWTEFGFCDSTVDDEHSPRGEAARAQLFCSPSSWECLHKTPGQGREFTALSWNFSRSWLGGFGRRGNVCLLSSFCRGFM